MEQWSITPYMDHAGFVDRVRGSRLFVTARSSRKLGGGARLRLIPLRSGNLTMTFPFQSWRCIALGSRRAKDIQRGAPEPMESF